MIVVLIRVDDCKGKTLNNCIGKDAVQVQVRLVRRQSGTERRLALNKFMW